MFKPIVNGLERDYFPEDTEDSQYLTSTGQIQMERLLDNFRDFIARAGFRILQVPDTPQEFIGQHLLFAYLDQFVTSVKGAMYNVNLKFAKNKSSDQIYFFLDSPP